MIERETSASAITRDLRPGKTETYEFIITGLLVKPQAYGQRDVARQALVALPADFVASAMATSSQSLKQELHHSHERFLR